MVEDWLSGRGDPDEGSSEDEDGYEKIIELYCHHLLPRLEECDPSVSCGESDNRFQSGKIIGTGHQVCNFSVKGYNALQPNITAYDISNPDSGL